MEDEYVSIKIDLRKYINLREIVDDSIWFQQNP